jgi:hypothetical protein
MDLNTVYFNHFWTKKIAQMQALLTYIWNMPNLNLSWDTECHDYAEIVPRSLYCRYYVLFCSLLCFLEFI